MSIRPDSYSSTGEVKAFTRHLLDGQSAFNSTTRPTGTELEKFIDRASATVNSALWQAGFNPAAVRANSTAKLTCDDWVTDQAVELVELTQRGTGYDDGDGSRVGVFRGLTKRADTFVKGVSLGFKRMGIAVANPTHQGLAYTGQEAAAERTDPTDTALSQPFARMRQFDTPGLANLNHT